MNNHIVGIYDTEEQAVKAVEQLKSKGYSIDEISMMAKNTKKLKETAEEVDPSTTDGAVAGAAAGGAIGITGFYRIKRTGNSRNRPSHRCRSDYNNTRRCGCWCRLWSRWIETCFNGIRCFE